MPAQQQEHHNLVIGVSKPQLSDMDLIEVLWRQDIDLGIDRDAFDIRRRLELEKQREFELIHQREKEKELEKQREEKLAKDNLNASFVLDRETGELVPAPLDPDRCLPVESFVPFTHQQQQQNETQQQQQGVLLPQQQPVMVQPEQLPQEHQQPFAIGEGLQMLEGVNTFNLSEQSMTQSGTLDTQLGELSDMIGDVTSVCEDDTQQPRFQHQNSFEQRWQDISNILPLDEDTDNTEYMIAELAKLLEDNNNNTDTLVEDSLMSNATLSNASPQMNVNELSFSEDLSVLQPVSLDPVEPLHLMSAEALGLNNESAPVNNTYVNSTATLLQHLLRDDIALDLNELSINGGEALMETDDISDSATSTGATTFDGEISDGQSNMSSEYDALEGATGGSDVDGGRNYEDTETKHKQDPEYTYGKVNYGSSELRLNHSDGSNASLSTIDSEADPRKVSHNHTYPLQPGQAPKERRTQKLLNEELAIHDAQYTRDEKRAKAMNIPLTMDEMISSPVERFNELVQNHHFTDSQLQLIRDIRRRGKNKVAAQNCRKRKMEVLQTLEEEVEMMKLERDQLRAQRRGLDKDMAAIRHKYAELQNDVFQSLVDDHGQPYDPSQYVLEQNDDGELFLIPHNATSCIKEQPKSKGSRKRKHDRKGR